MSFLCLFRMTSHDSRRYMAEVLPMRRKTVYNQSINQSSHDTRIRISHFKIHLAHMYNMSSPLKGIKITTPPPEKKYIKNY